MSRIKSRTFGVADVECLATTGLKSIFLVYSRICRRETVIERSCFVALLNKLGPLMLSVLRLWPQFDSPRTNSSITVKLL